MSSLFGNTTKLPSDKPKPWENLNIPTNEQGVVLRYFDGIARFSGTWLGPAYNVRTKEKSSGGGKGGGKSGSGGGKTTQYFGDCAALLCLGPADVIWQVWINNDLAWSGAVTRSGDSAVISIPKRGTMYLYWGTETQGIDPILAPHGHPAYRGQVIAVFKQLYFGDNTPNPPSFEVLLGRWPASVLPTTVDFDSDVHPPHSMIELLTHPRFGAGWDAASTLVLADWTAACQQVRDEEIALSPVLDRDQDMRSWLTEFCGYFDGYLVADPAQGGRLSLRLARRFAGDTSTLPLIGEHELTAPPELEPQHWSETANEVFVRYTDRDNYFNSNSEPWINLAGRRAANGMPLPLTLDRSWLTRKYQAAKAAQYAGRQQGHPWVGGTIEVRRDAVEGLEPGDFFRLTYRDWLRTLVVRVLRRKVSNDRAQTVELEVRSDGYYADLLPYVDEGGGPNVPVPVQPIYTPPATTPPDPGVEPQPALYTRIVELPQPLAAAHGMDLSRPALATLVARSGALDVRAATFVSLDGSSYSMLSQTRGWCFQGTLASAYGAGDVLDDSATGMLIDLAGGGPELAAEVPSTDETGRLVQRLLVWVDDEIVAYREAQLVSATRVRLVGLRRACFDTAIAAHASGAIVAILAADDLGPYSDPAWQAGTFIYTKVAPGTAAMLLDLTDVVAQTRTLINRTARPLGPLNLRINGQTAGPVALAVSTDATIEFDATSWDRRPFWASWSDPIFDPSLVHQIQLRDASDAVLRVLAVLDAGVTSYTYSAADLALDLAQYGASLQVWVYALRGLLSVNACKLAITLS